MGSISDKEQRSLLFFFGANDIQSDKQYGGIGAHC
jgi:hypothetical protein